MALWKNTDDAANSVISAAAQFKLAPNTTNQTALFGNTTADAFITGATVGQFGVDTNEARANGDIPHAGWVLRTVGSGGRAGRVQHEVLVAMSTITTASDAEDIAYPDLTILITGQPVSATGDISNNDIVTFTVTAGTEPEGGTLGYIWQKWDGSAFANLTNAGAYSNVATATLSVLANTATDAEIYRAEISATGATTVDSANAVITIVS